MTDLSGCGRPARTPPPRVRAAAAAAWMLGLLALAACGPAASASGSPVGTPLASDPGPSPTATATAAPTATPEPELSLALPGSRDERAVRVSVAPDVPGDGDGELVVTVTNLSDTRVTELVLRWHTELAATLFLAPFRPSELRIVEGGPPLLQDWTKWVVGPGERGEPAGTTSLGWGPLDPGATLTIPIVVTRQAPGDVSFDFQLLAGEAILSLEDGAPAELRVSVP